ncbi:xanthine/uracil permease family transport protein [Natronomonas pharaonis DSM 2160]|uniref:Xanthine/uracil permease family transport protein n=1 Tax=Natronomonas pharaonis (strain ATCC 35678 / DSM 2160 / CIP 103997 / JCM 8858 / NBRC 14720 / NCIMB 2260 / Gabara) TaxID=348780 RepID=A0A1U7EUR9_NATPD|nr:NCS2 family permease [Natronomonas pharaonis]CAI48717.1 xanthine/uracil permease family transport protein [Natronomonas pharaonis DSM 2160]
MGVGDSLAAYFDFDEYGTDYRTETVAGATTFLAMAYIIVVNPAILSEAIMTDPPAGMNQGEVIQMLAVVTILASVAAILVMAFYAKRPFGLAPGMGLNAFFAFTVVIGLGVPWQVALAAVFVEGLIFIALTAIGARRYVIELFPEPVKFAVGAGIGIFLLFLGLQEMNVVAAYPDGTLVELGNFLLEPAALVAVAGLGLTLFLYARGIKGSIIVGILTTAAAGWVAALMLPNGEEQFAPPAYADVQEQGFVPYLLDVQYNFLPLVEGFVSGLGQITEDPLVFLLVVFTFFVVDFFDTAGTLIGVSGVAGFLDDDGNLPDIDKPLMADAVGTTVGAVIGTSTVTTFIESSTGVEEGGRTGFTALVVGLLFLASLAVVPLVSLMPLYATYIALVVVGIIMLQGVADIDWEDPVWAISGGLTITVMPLTASIADGLAAGILSYPLIKTAVGERRDVTLGQWILALALVAYYVFFFLADGGFVAF